MEINLLIKIFIILNHIIVEFTAGKNLTEDFVFRNLPLGMENINNLIFIYSVSYSSLEIQCIPLMWDIFYKDLLLIVTYHDEKKSEYM